MTSPQHTLPPTVWIYIHQRNMGRRGGRGGGGTGGGGGCNNTCTQPVNPTVTEILKTRTPSPTRIVQNLSPYPGPIFFCFVLITKNIPLLPVFFPSRDPSLPPPSPTKSQVIPVGFLYSYTISMHKKTKKQNKAGKKQKRTLFSIGGAGL